MENQNHLNETGETDQLSMMRAALPYLPPSSQRMFSVFTKYLELKNTIRSLSKPPKEMQICSASKTTKDPLEMLCAMEKACSGSMKEQLGQMIQMLTMFQLLDSSQNPFSQQDFMQQSDSRNDDFKL